MAPLSKSRRRIQRAPSSDIEEENDQSQRHADDVDEDEDVQPVRKKTTVKKEKKSKTNRNISEPPKAGPSNANNGDDDDNDDEVIDIQNFRDQPLDEKEGTKLLGMSRDWEAIRKQIHQGSFRLAREVAVSLADVFDADSAGEPLNEVDGMMKKLIDIDEVLRSHEAILANLHQALVRGEVVENVIEMYQTGVKEQMDKYHEKTTRQKYASNEHYVTFKQGIFEVQHPGEAIPPINDLVPREDGDPSDDEEDLEVGGVTQDYKCPITLVVLVEPMTSRVCGHSYSRAAIQEFLERAGRNGTLCPASGCTKKVTMDNLEADKELEKKIKIAGRRQEIIQDSDEDDGEVIE